MEGRETWGEDGCHSPGYISMVLKYLTAWTIFSPSPLSNNIPRASLALSHQPQLPQQIASRLSLASPLTALARWYVTQRRCGSDAA
jgi:hypothetical protein